MKRSLFTPMLVFAVGIPAFTALLGMTWALAHSYLAMIAVALMFYVALHAVMEPWRPPGEPSLFPEHVAARIRERSWLSPR